MQNCIEQLKPVCYLTPNNFSHKAGEGMETRKRNIAHIHPALLANPGSTQQTYILMEDQNEQPDRSNRIT